MRLLLYGLNFWPELTGVGKYSGEMAQWLSEHGHTVNVVAAPPYYPAWQVPPEYSAARYTDEVWGLDGRVCITRCPIWVPRQPSTLRRLLHLISFALSSLPALWRALRKRPDILMVVVPTLFVVPAALLMAKLWRIPAWVHVQDFEVEAMFNLGLGGRSGLVRRMALFIESRLLRAFDRASSISRSMVDRLAAKGVMSARCVEFPNWVNLAAVFPILGFNSFRAELKLGPDDVLVLYAGNMGEKQGLEIMIEAARVMTNTPHVRFALAGSGSATQRLRITAEGLPNVVWLPLQPISRLNEMLNAADIHLLPQRADAADLLMPSKLTGMLASGRATVGTAATETQLGQVLEQAGYRVDPSDVDALVKALRLLALDAGLRSYLGRRGRAYAEEYLGLDAIMTRFELQLESIATEKGIARR